MNWANQLINSFLLKEGISYLDKDPINNLPKILNWAEKIAVKENHKVAINTFRKIINDPNNNWNKLINRILAETHPNVQKKFLINYFVNAGMAGNPVIDAMKEKHKCNIPWAILLDPTAACNLKCVGCWAGEYDKAASLDNNTIDRIIREGKDLGIYMYVLSGGEPLVRKKDILYFADKHNDCLFLAFTNGTLIDQEFAKEVQRLGNIMFAISVEGIGETTDMRRGAGTFEKVMRGMDILKQYGLGFGFSACYHHYNTEEVGSEEYIDFMIEKGCLFGWYFTYIPLGKDADLNLLATPEQREYMYHQVRTLRDKKPIFLIDFWNDGEYIGGCIAGGRHYIHINANGDVEPCAFIHYANVNIKDVSLLEALKSPLFMEYKNNHPFNKNHLRPCPLLDNPEKLREMVHRSKAYSTQPIDQESIDELAAKCENIAQEWGKVADRLWIESGRQLD